MLQARGLASSMNKIIISLTSLENALVGASRGVSTSLPRFYSSDDAKPDNEQPAAADTGAEAVPTHAVSQPEDAPAPSGPTQADLLAQGYTKRQAKWISPDPEKQKHFLPKLSRKELGSYNSEAAAAQFGSEVELYPRVPDVPIYNLREVVPEMVQPRSDTYNAFKAAKLANPKADITELAAAIGVVLPPPTQPYAVGAEPILEWEVRLVLTPAAAGEPHPANKKAKCRVHLRALQRQTGLSDAGLIRIAEIAGPRYNEKTGILTLTSEKYSERELNREHIVGMIQALVEEGKKVDAGQAAVASG